MLVYRHSTNVQTGEKIVRSGGGRRYQILQEPKDKWFPEETVREIDEYIKTIQTSKK